MEYANTIHDALVNMHNFEYKFCIGSGVIHVLNMVVKAMNLNNNGYESVRMTLRRKWLLRTSLCVVEKANFRKVALLNAMIRETWLLLLLLLLLL